MPPTSTTAGAVVIPEADAKVEHDSVDAKLVLLDQMVQDILRAAEEWSAAGLLLRRVAPDAPAGGEAIATGPMQIVRDARRLSRTLTSIRDTGDVSLPGAPTARPDGQVVVPVFPTSKLDAMAFVGREAEVWMQPHVTPDTLRTAGLYKDPPSEGKACFVLAAGNFSASGPSDALHRLFAEGEVCVVRMNPVNEHLGPDVERSLTPFIREGSSGWSTAASRPAST